MEGREDCLWFTILCLGRVKEQATSGRLEGVSERSTGCPIGSGAGPAGFPPLVSPVGNESQHGKTSVISQGVEAVWAAAKHIPSRTVLEAAS